MAYEIEKGSGDIVVSGWEAGIGASPHKGIGNIQCANITTIPGEVMCNYSRIQESQSAIAPVTILPSTGTTLLFHNGIVPLQPGNWVTASSSSITNFTSGTAYFILSVGTPAGGYTPITLATTLDGTLISNFQLTGTAVGTLINMGQPIAWAATSEALATFPNQSYFILDATGFVWFYTFNTTFNPSGVWQLINKIAIPNATNKSGIFCYGGYLVAATDQLYYKSLSSLSTLGTNWHAFSTAANLVNSSTTHFCLLGHDEVVYITDGYYLASLSVIAGQQATYFDPTNTATYTWASAGVGAAGAALTFPETETTNTLAELGLNIVIGCWSANLYQWNRTPIEIGNGQALNSFFYPLLLPENYVSSMVTVNNLLYVFAGVKGNIVITNGTTISGVLTIPDYVTGEIEPYYIWGATMFLRSRIWFSVQDSNSKTGGVWSFVPTQSYFIEQDTGSSIRLEAQNTYGTYAGLALVLIPVLEIGAESSSQVAGQQARGAQYWSGWDDGTSGASLNPYGIDFSGNTPYTGGQTIIETDAIPTGTMLQERSFGQIEYKLATALASVTTTTALLAGATSATLSSAWAGTSGSVLVTFSSGKTKNVAFTASSTAISWSGGLINNETNVLVIENVTINWRTDLSAAYQSTGADMQFNPPNTAGYFVPDFEFTQWLQLQVVLTSTTAPNASFVRLKELRIR